MVKFPEFLCSTFCNIKIDFGDIDLFSNMDFSTACIFAGPFEDWILM